MALASESPSSPAPRPGFRMPALFVGHGSPMNAIEDNAFSREWRALGASLPRPAAILCVSAHWETHGVRVTSMERPKTIHDFGGFPQALFDVRYPAPGDPALARGLAGRGALAPLALDESWGLDHGTWSVLRCMYPGADIPVVQLSLDRGKTFAQHYALAKELAYLRDQGVLIVGSGDIVHNLGVLDFSLAGGFEWAEAFNSKVKSKVRGRDHAALCHLAGLGPEARLAVPTPEHYLPLLYTLAQQGREEEASFFTDALTLGSISMTGIRIG